MNSKKKCEDTTEVFKLILHGDRTDASAVSTIARTGSTPFVFVIFFFILNINLSVPAESANNYQPMLFAGDDTKPNKQVVHDYTTRSNNFDVYVIS